MTIEPLDYVSIIGTSFIEPLLTLIDTLDSMEQCEPNEVQTSRGENGYSAAIIVLSALLAESALNRTRYVRENDGNGGQKQDKTHVVEYFFEIIKSDNRLSHLNDLALDLEEIFAVRDIITHNHVWKAQILWDIHGSPKFSSTPKLLPYYGDKRFRKILDLKTRQSKRLRLNLFPSRIWRRDAWVIVKTVGRVLRALEEIDRRYFYLTPQPFKFRGKNATFYEVEVGLIPSQNLAGDSLL